MDVRELPEKVERGGFVEWRNRAVRDDAVALVLEPRITFAGKGYRAGFSGSSGTHVGYSRAAYARVVAAAQDALRCENVTVIERNWLDSLNTLEAGDFAYIDPPYYGTSACYDNISHESLVARLNTAPFQWALSGYPSPLYDDELRYAHRYVRERNSEIKSSNARQRTPVNEVLWTSY
uniref:Putative methyltransferase n=1 Tax=viral metagenome TaxID=1070528 RepID=A0A6M3LCC9_9ZZZZ